jgi:hypothetical protein
MSGGRLTTLVALAGAVGLVGGWIGHATLKPPPTPPDLNAETRALLQADRDFAQLSR